MKRCIGIACIIICFAIIAVSVVSCNLTPTVTPDPCSYPDPVLDLDFTGGTFIMLEADLSHLPTEQSPEDALRDTADIIQKRLNIYGVKGSLLRYGVACERIAVEVPGVNLTDEDIDIITATAQLEFREQQVDASGNVTWVPATATINGEVKELTSAYFKENTYVTTDNMGRVLLIFEWNDEGSQISAQVTGRLIGKPLAIFLSGQPLLGDNGQPIAPIVQSQIADRGQIEGLSLSEATELSNLLNAGRIPVILRVLIAHRITPDKQ